MTVEASRNSSLRDAAAREAPQSPHTPTIEDVWSWTARKYRVRATVLLLINLLLFCGLCAFTHWLRVHRVFDFSVASYYEPLRFWGADTQNLYDFILYPISVDQVPIHGIVIGLLMASIVAVPISVAILYRFRSALPFVAAVLIFAHMPWLALTLVLSCVLAAVPPFRMKFRFGSALVAMLPVLFYLYLATRGPTDPLSASVSPERKLLLIGPWLLAIIAACTMLAVIIFIARIVNYRPGAVAPVMAIMFAMPATLFHVAVGVDELSYRHLEMEFGPRSERFEPVQDVTDWILSRVRELDREDMRSMLLVFLSADTERQLPLKRRYTERLLRDLQLELMRDRRAADRACTEFIADHPRSRYVPAALYVQGRALDTRLDERRLVGETIQREFYTEFPHIESEPVWANLIAEYPDSPLAVVARLRLAQLRLRRGEADGALEVLRAQPQFSADTIQVRQRRFLGRLPVATSLDYAPEQDLFASRRLAELISANADDPKCGAAPLQALATLDPHRPRYQDQLQRLAAQYPDCLAYDNIVVRWASAHEDRDIRAARLAACLERFSGGDAVPEAMFQLADLELQRAGDEDPQRRKTGIARMYKIVQEHDDSCWARLAAERLRLLDPQGKLTTYPTEQP